MPLTSRFPLTLRRVGLRIGGSSPADPSSKAGFESGHYYPSA
jgi:hypothetical protein